MIKCLKILLVLLVFIIDTKFSTAQVKNTAVVTVITSENFDNINPIISNSRSSSQIESLVFQRLFEIDNKTLSHHPILCEALPTVDTISVEKNNVKTKGVKISYEIKENAIWDDGKPITAYDVEFSLKCIKTPTVDCYSLRPYYSDFIDFRIDETNPKKFSFIISSNYFLNVEHSNLYILPKHIYDAQGYLDAFSIKILSDTSLIDSLLKENNLVQFAKKFNKNDIPPQGSGPYTHFVFDPNNSLILYKKMDWWGKDILLPGFNNEPDSIKYKIIFDYEYQLEALEQGLGDILEITSIETFSSIQKEKKYSEDFNFYSTPKPAFNYIGINTKDEILSDVKIREAISMSINYPLIFKKYLKGFADGTIGPIHPISKCYNNEIAPYQYDPKKAKEILEEAGWKDLNGDKIRDKIINEDTLSLSFSIMQVGSNKNEKITLELKESFADVGIKLILENKEWTVYLDKISSHDFDLYFGAWVSYPSEIDLKQIWHTDSYIDGSNYTGFGNAYTDSLIEEINFSFDKERRKLIYLEMQEIIHKEAPYIFLFVPHYKFIVSKRITNFTPSLKYPGFDVSSFSKTNH